MPNLHKYFYYYTNENLKREDNYVISTFKTDNIVVLVFLISSFYIDKMFQLRKSIREKNAYLGKLGFSNLILLYDDF